MNKKVIHAVCTAGGFLFGGGLGYLIGYYQAKKKYKTVATKVFKFEIPETSKSEEEPVKPDTYNKELYKIVSDLNYAPPEPPITNPLIYTITLDDFATNRIFDQVVAYWYDEDGVLMDGEGKEMDPAVTVGNLQLETDAYDEGELLVRNEKLGTDFRIILENHHVTDSVDYPGFDDEE